MKLKSKNFNSDKIRESVQSTVKIGVFSLLFLRIYIQPWWLGVFIRHVFHSVNSCLGHTMDQIPSEYGVLIVQRGKPLFTIRIVERRAVNSCEYS